MNDRNRVSLRAASAGLFVFLGIFLVWMTGAAALDLWEFRITDLAGASTALWIWAAAGWTLSAFLAAFVAGGIGRSADSLEGAFTGLTTWAMGASVHFIFFGFASGRIFGFMYDQPIPSGAFALTLLGAILALASAIYGGILASRRNQELARKVVRFDTQRPFSDEDTSRLVVQEHLSMRDRSHSEPLSH